MGFHWQTTAAFVGFRSGLSKLMRAVLGATGG